VITPYRKQSSKKEQVEEMFDGIAPTYDRLNRILSFNVDKGWRKKCISLLKERNPKRVLDVATGTADLAIECLKAEPDEIIGLDLSEQMLAVGRKKLNRKGIENIELVKGDCENLPFETASFDALTCAFGVRNFGDLDAGLKEMYRVTKEGGQALVLEFSTPKSKFFRQLYYFYFFSVLPLIGRLISGDSRAYKYLPESVKVFPSGEAFAGRMRAAGFKTVICHPRTFGICTIYQGVK